MILWKSSKNYFNLDDKTNIVYPSYSKWYHPKKFDIRNFKLDAKSLTSQEDTIETILNQPYKYGFKSNVEEFILDKGLSRETVDKISKKKNEPSWLLQFRNRALQKWLTLEEPRWSDNIYPPIEYQNISYFAAPKKKGDKGSLMDIDPELLSTYEKLGISLSEQKRISNVAVDAVFDSVSIATTSSAELLKSGVIFCSITKAVKTYPDLVRKYLGAVVPINDNYFATLNSAVFTDGSFVFLAKGVKCPMEISTYFRINASETGQFERTLIVCQESSQVTYLEGCTAPLNDTEQLHAAVVELYTKKRAEIYYTTVQNWYAGDSSGNGGIYNFVTKRGLCEGENSKISWTQVETGSSITWKYPSVNLKGNFSIGEFYSVALTNTKQQADTGSKMLHIGKGSRSNIVSKGISAGESINCYRGLVHVFPSSENARNYSQCDSMLIGKHSRANTYPYILVRNPSACVEHEASTTKIGYEQLFYFQQRGIQTEHAVSMIISGYCREVFKKLPLEFAAEVNQLMSLKMEGSIG